MADPGVSTQQGAINQERDSALARMDEAEVRLRMLETFDLFVRKGFETHLVGLEVRGTIDYRIELETDGHGPIDVRELTAIADQHRLDSYVDKSSTTGQLVVVCYARS